MKRFIVRLLIFLTPLIIFLIPPTLVLFLSKEAFYGINKILSDNEKYLIGYSYQENNYGYAKWTYLNSNNKKNVWTLGSSRVLQFREEMFDVPFYNAGYTIISINDFRPFISSFPKGKYPKYLILGLDQWMFNKSFDDLKTTPAVDSWKNSFTYYSDLFPTYKTIYRDLEKGKYTFSSLLSESDSYTKIGIYAKVKDTGLRNDGSFYYGDQIEKLIKKDSSARDFNYSNTLSRIKYGNKRFQHGKSINNRALKELNELLWYCKSNDIEVIAFLPPFADKVYNMMEESGNYHYMKEIYPKVLPIFKKYDYEVYDFSSVTLCNSNDNETIDGFHGGELTYQKLLINMLDSGSILNQVTTAERLRGDLLHKKSNFLIYSY
jgi:hypothetical protein